MMSAQRRAVTADQFDGAGHALMPVDLPALEAVGGRQRAVPERARGRGLVLRTL